MDWESLRYVLAVGRHGSLNKAASSLSVTHTTVSRRVRSLEEQLRVRLFDRTPQGYVSTNAGQELVDLASAFEGEVLAAEGRVLGGDTKLSGTLRVSTLDFLFESFYEDFSEFCGRYPSVEFTLSAENREVSLSRREADVALRLSNGPPEHLVGRRVGRVEFAVYGSTVLVESVGMGSDYGEFPWIGRDPRSPSPSWMTAWMERHAAGAKIVFSVDGSAMVLRRAIAAGIGVHFLPCFYAATLPDLKQIGPVHEEFGRDLWLLTLAELRSNQRVRAFMDHMGRASIAQPGALGGNGL
ncbi:MAG: LysR family transcriptional regulator [Myxococcota bacterium]